VRRWWRPAVTAMAAACLVSMNACELSGGGREDDEDDKDDDTEETKKLDVSRLRDVTWVLKSWGKTGKENKPISGTTINLKFDDVDDASGYAGCNYYISDYTARDDGYMDFDSLQRTTSYSCSVQRRNQEDEYLDNLRDATRFDFEEDGDLRLYYDDGYFMVFE